MVTSVFSKDHQGLDSHPSIYSENNSHHRHLLSAQFKTPRQEAEAVG